MTEPEFWQLIGLIDTTALDDGDEDEAVAPLQAALITRPEADLFAFEELLSQTLYAIDGEAFADQAGDSGNSDDAFLYARCYVVAKGQAFYEAVKSDPARMPKSIDEWCESLLSTHCVAWAEQTGNDQEDFPFTASVSYETGSNAGLWHDR